MSSGSDSESNASGSRSASPAGSPNHNSGRSRSVTPADNASNASRSRSPSAESNKSERSAASSNKSRQSRSRSPSVGSNASNRSGGSRASDASNRSGASGRSNRSSSNRSSIGKPQSPAGSAKSGSTNRSRSRSSSPDGGDKNSAAGSNKSSRSNSRSRSASPEPDPKQKKDSDDDKEKKSNEAAESEEEGEDQDKEVSAAAIFGDADDISSEEEKEREEQENQQQPEEPQEEEKETRSDEDENQEDSEMRQDDGENEPETIPETRIDVQIPKISCDLGRDIHFVKLPNFLSVETRPFDPETYEDEIDEEETLDEEGRARLKLKVENTIRWREIVDKEGNIKKQSNARLVRWSDGSYSLHLGSEIFDVYKQPLQGDHNHLFIRQGTGLQGQAVFRTKLSFRPHSTESFTHRKMTLSLADRSQKISGIKILSQVGVDPDHDRKSLLKKEEEKLRQTVRASKPRKKGDSTTRLHLNNSTYREDEGSDEDGAISLNAIKNKYKSGAAAKGGTIYSSDEDGSDIEAKRARKLDKALKDSESSAESE